jgi:pimeloyl-ACP methyl ester carboxylesterase
MSSRATTPAADPASRAARGAELAARSAFVLQKRAQLAQERFSQAASQAAQRLGPTTPATFAEAATQSTAYWTDLAQRSVLFWDTLRERGNRYIEHVRAGSPPVLSFEYEPVLDARALARPANYALVRIVPPAGVEVNARLRPYVIIDPRAGHGPGIGGMKDDSQVGVALRAGHPVYFVMFFPEPEPGQTLLDVCAAEREFIRKVRSLHPKSPKPVIIGNCQGGWAAMMLAASEPNETGPLVINGAPMSYWGGAWSEGEGDNPMRYAGGMLGGTWLASLVSDLGAGKFDGAWLVQNFENLNPANTFWDKYYHLFANVDTEAPRFLEFERWWGGFFLMNREEIEWITQNLFVGNQVWSRADASGLFDLRTIRSPIVLFASLGDNITPPQQAFNWVADVYGSTEEIKAHGQVIVGLLHESTGHLGIFVSGKVAKKEYSKIVEVMEAIEALPPGLYAMKITERAGGGYDVSFEERRLEDAMKRLNRFARADEKAFANAKMVSEFNQRAYEIFGRPAARGMASEDVARFARSYHPLRMQRWAFSDLNPWMAALGPVAAAVRASRKPLGAESAPRRFERYMSDMLSASLDYYRAMRDAASEAAFFQAYGNVLALDAPATQSPSEAGVALHDQAFAREAIARIGEGGYAAAIARVAAMLARTGQPIPLARLDLKRELVRKYDALLPHVEPEEWRRIRGEQEVVVRLEPELALETLRLLVPATKDRERLMSLVDHVIREGGAHGVSPTTEQQAMLARIRDVLSTGSTPRLRKAAAGARRRKKATT